MAAPRLRVYHFSSIFESESLRAPWSQLTEISVSFDMTAKECIDILRQCTQLVHCTIGKIVLQCIHVAYFPAQPPVVLDRMRFFLVNSFTEAMT